MAEDTNTDKSRPQLKVRRIGLDTGRENVTPMKSAFPNRRSGASPSLQAAWSRQVPRPPPESLDAVRAKIQGRTLKPAEIEAGDLTHYRYSDMEIATANHC